jgi:ADP-ribosyl-[dinitrogen reductase] hydrolase
MRDRVRGCLLGLAVGDALGTTLEFRRPGTFAPITDMVGGGPFGLNPGEWTDDASMALCLAESLLERRGFDPVDQLTRYVRWWRQGHLSSNGRCFDIGNTVRDALRRFEETAAPFCGSTDPGTAGNGSLMRLAPVPLYYRRDRARAVEMSGESSRTTHGAAEAVDACRLYGGLIVDALDGRPKDQLLANRRADPGTPRGSGYVVDSMAAALWAFSTTATFRDGALAAVNLGDDADTTGAIYGQLAGAFYGEAAIPSAWRGRLARRDLIEGFADRLLNEPA